HASAAKINPDPRDCDEFALVNKQWQPVNDPGTMVAGEERHPLSPAVYTEEDQRNRRLLVGLIPVGDRERLLQAVQPNPAGQPALPPLIDARQMLLKTQVIGPLKNLEDVAERAFKATLPPPDPKVDPKADPALVPLTKEQEDARQRAIPDILESAND